MSSINNLVLVDVTKSYESTRILDGVSLTVQPGETVAIVGPSGSGKSTLLNIIGSLDTPTSGSLHLGNIDIIALNGKSLADFRATQVGFVFQDHHLLSQLTAIENVLIPTMAMASSQNSVDQARKLLDRVGISNRADAFPAQMSGGERQRVAIARALINGAKLLLCDEPTGNLDKAAGENIVSLLLEIAREQGAAVLMVTHNSSHASRFSRCMELADGRLIPLAGEL